MGFVLLFVLSFSLNNLAEAQLYHHHHEEPFVDERKCMEVGTFCFDVKDNGKYSFGVTEHWTSDETIFSLTDARHPNHEYEWKCIFPQELDDFTATIYFTKYHKKAGMTPHTRTSLILKKDSTTKNITVNIREEVGLKTNDPLAKYLTDYEHVKVNQTGNELVLLFDSEATDILGFEERDIFINFIMKIPGHDTLAVHPREVVDMLHTRLIIQEILSHSTQALIITGGAIFVIALIIMVSVVVSEKRPSSRRNRCSRRSILDVNLPSCSSSVSDKTYYTYQTY